MPTIFHIEDQPQSVQDHVYRLIGKCAEHGIQLTHLDFVVVEGRFLTLDGMDADQWVDAMTMR